MEARLDDSVCPSGMSWPAKILTFWFDELDPKDWWTKSDDLDDSIRKNFFELWQGQKSKTAADFVADAETALAATILFDQFPRNMFRDSADAYSTDHLAQKIAERAVELELDQKLSAIDAGASW